MVYNRFALKVILHIIFLTITSLLFTWSLQQDYLMVTKFTFAVLLIIEVLLLIRLVTRTNRSLQIFLEALKSADFVKNAEQNDSFKMLHITYNDIIDIVKKARIERESQFYYFQYTLEHIPVGVLSISRDGRVELMNTAAKKLLGKEQIVHIDELDTVKSGLAQHIKALIPGESELLELSGKNHKKRLLLKSIAFKLYEKDIQLVSLQNIKEELEEEELLAWQKLISVLRHEIMNSVGPVMSLTNTLLRMFETHGKVKSPSELSEQTLNDAVAALHSIQNRNEGMAGFVKSYRELTKIPSLQKSKLLVSEIFKGINILLAEELKGHDIHLSLSVVPDDMVIEADERLLTQILINLVNNATDALAQTKEKQLSLKAYVNNDGEKCIVVEDNGSGISPEFQGKIFIPFFTTKPHGSGIGLSLTRQIMRLHGGTLSVQSEEGKGAVFSLIFS